ncbi:MAG TPA: hypothetical protein VGW40_10500 [Allosphingosinicella sp.]|nr:hypothetical protein [Allosphingosinicella sp.]
MSNETASSGRRPTHRLFLVTGEGEQAIWLQLGAAWPNRDGKGFSLTLQAVPLTGRIVMREISDEDREK